MELKLGYKQTEVGVIPEDWKVLPLCDLAQIRGGIAKNSNVGATDPISVHYLRVANVQDGYLDLSEMSKIELSRRDLNRYTVLPGDVLMNEGGDLDQLGRGALWRGEFNPCVHQNHVFVVRCKPTLLPNYLNVWTASSPARRFFLSVGKQTTNLASISKTSLGGLPVAVPSFPEQEVIAEALSDADSLIESLEQLVAKKHHLKQGAMQDLLTGKKRLPGFSGEWEAKQLGNVAPLQRGFDLPNPQLRQGIYPVVYSNGVLNQHVIFQVRGPGVVTGRSGTIGKVCFIEQDYWPHNTTLWVTNFKGNDPKFIFYLLNSIGLERFSSGSGVPTLNRNDVHSHTVCIPLSEGEQSAIATVLSDMDAEIVELEAQLAKARTIKQGMMHKLLTGEIRLP